jgi:hypothetical protein
MMTKALFRTLALQAVEELCAMPDDLWEETIPTIRRTYRRSADGAGEVLVVGLEPEDADKGGALT